MQRDFSATSEWSSKTVKYYLQKLRVPDIACVPEREEVLEIMPKS